MTTIRSDSGTRSESQTLPRLTERKLGKLPAVAVIDCSASRLAVAEVSCHSVVGAMNPLPFSSYLSVTDVQTLSAPLSAPLAEAIEYDTNGNATMLRFWIRTSPVNG